MGLSRRSPQKIGRVTIRVPNPLGLRHQTIQREGSNVLCGDAEHSGFNVSAPRSALPEHSKPSHDWLRALCSVANLTVARFARRNCERRSVRVRVVHSSEPHGEIRHEQSRCATRNARVSGYAVACLYQALENREQRVHALVLV
jgi:hypothetical protein